MRQLIKKGVMFLAVVAFGAGSSTIALAESDYLLATSAANATEVLKWAHVYEAASPYHKMAVWAADEFYKRTNGRYKINVFPASQLGVEAAINEGISIGSVDIIYAGSAFTARSYGPLSISDYPFMFRDFNHWQAYRDSDLFKGLSDEFRKITGNTITALTYYGVRHVTANKPILKPEDMKNLKIRVPNAPAYMMFPKETGANPVPMAFAEVYLALQQGVVDAQENPLPTIKFKKFYEVQKHINLTGHITNSILTIISGLTIDKMKPADYKILAELTREAATRATDEIVEAENTLSSWFEKQGITVNKVNRVPFIKALEKALTSKDVPYSIEQYKALQAL